MKDVFSSCFSYLHQVLPPTLPDLSTLPPQCTTWISIHFRLSPATTIWHHAELRQPDLIDQFLALASKLGILLEGFTLRLHLQKDQNLAHVIIFHFGKGRLTIFWRVINEKIYLFVKQIYLVTQYHTKGDSGWKWSRIISVSANPIIFFKC